MLPVIAAQKLAFCAVYWKRAGMKPGAR
jgi:hypothetical protein